ncbi:MAG: class B sortase [Candidatus Fimenecus sp.]
MNNQQYARATDLVPDTPPQKPPQKKRKKGGVLNRIITVLAVLVLLVSGGICVKYFKEVYDSKKQAESIAELTSAPEAETYPAEPAAVQPQYRAAYNENNDLVGWIVIPNTTINQPVVQANDNDYYMRRNFYKEYERRGSVFMDYRNSIDTFNKNTIIYGHNYLDSTMFSDLEKYKDIEFYKTAPVIEFNTIYADYKWKVFAVFLTTASPELDNGYVFNYIYPFMTDDNFADFIAEVHKRSLYHTDVEVLPTDKILTLQTCTRDLDLSARKQEDARCIVMARLVREGESETVDVTKATVNENPKYPQLYYDKYNLENPYRDDEKWYPKGE